MFLYALDYVAEHASLEWLLKENKLSKSCLFFQERSLHCSRHLEH